LFQVMKIQSLGCVAALALVVALGLATGADAMNPFQQEQM
jgi:hypothetical protein